MLDAKKSRGSHEIVQTTRDCGTAPVDYPSSGTLHLGFFPLCMGFTRTAGCNYRSTMSRWFLITLNQFVCCYSVIR